MSPIFHANVRPPPVAYDHLRQPFSSIPPIATRNRPNQDADLDIRPTNQKPAFPSAHPFPQPNNVTNLQSPLRPDVTRVGQGPKIHIFFYKNMGLEAQA